MYTNIFRVLLFFVIVINRLMAGSPEAISLIDNLDLARSLAKSFRESASRIQITANPGSDKHLAVQRHIRFIELCEDGLYRMNIIGRMRLKMKKPVIFTEEDAESIALNIGELRRLSTLLVESDDMSSDSELKKRFQELIKALAHFDSLAPAPRT
jgi:hypothetical protein